MLESIIPVSKSSSSFVAFSHHAIAPSKKFEWQKERRLAFASRIRRDRYASATDRDLSKSYNFSRFFGLLNWTL